MGANHSNAKHQQNLYNTPPKKSHRLLYDPRSPNEAISRTPIQIDGQAAVISSKMYNHVTSPIVGPDLPARGENNENQHPNRLTGEHSESDMKRTSGVEPTLDPTTVLTAIVANNSGQLPPYQL